MATASGKFAKRKKKKIAPEVDPLMEEEMAVRQAPVANAGSVASTAAMGNGWGAYGQPGSSEVNLDREMTVAPPANPIGAVFGQKEMGGGGGPASDIDYKRILNEGGGPQTKGPESLGLVPEGGFGWRGETTPRSELTPFGGGGGAGMSAGMRLPDVMGQDLSHLFQGGPSGELAAQREVELRRQAELAGRGSLSDIQGPGGGGVLGDAGLLDGTIDRTGEQLRTGKLTAAIEQGRALTPEEQGLGPGGGILGGQVPPMDTDESLARLEAQGGYQLPSGATGRDIDPEAIMGAGPEFRASGGPDENLLLGGKGKQVWEGIKDIPEVISKIPIPSKLKPFGGSGGTPVTAEEKPAAELEGPVEPSDTTTKTTATGEDFEYHTPAGLGRYQEKITFALQGLQSGNPEGMKNLINATDNEIRLPEGYSVTRDEADQPVLKWTGIPGGKAAAPAEGTDAATAIALGEDWSTDPTGMLSGADELKLNNAMQMREQALDMITGHLEDKLALGLKKEELAMVSQEFKDTLAQSAKEFEFREEQFETNTSFQQAAITGMFGEEATMDGKELMARLTGQVQVGAKRKWQWDDPTKPGLGGSYLESPIMADTPEMQKMRAELTGMFGEEPTVNKQQWEAAVTGYMANQSPTFAREQFEIAQEQMKSKALTAAGKVTIDGLRTVDDLGMTVLTDKAQAMVDAGILTEEQVKNDIAFVDNLESQRSKLEERLAMARATGQMTVPEYGPDDNPTGRQIPVATLEQQKLDMEQQQLTHIQSMESKAQSMQREAQGVRQALETRQMGIQERQMTLQEQQAEEVGKERAAAGLAAAGQVDIGDGRVVQTLEGQQQQFEIGMANKQFAEMQAQARGKTLIGFGRKYTNKELVLHNSNLAPGAEPLSEGDRMPVYEDTLDAQKQQLVSDQWGNRLTDADYMAAIQRKTTEQQITKETTAAQERLTQQRTGVEQRTPGEAAATYSQGLSSALGNASVENTADLEAALNAALPPIPAGMVWDGAGGALKFRQGYEGRDIDPETQRHMEEIAPALRARDRAEKVLGQLQNFKFQMQATEQAQAQADTRLRSALQTGDIIEAEEAAYLKRNAETAAIEQQTKNSKYQMVFQLMQNPTALGMAQRYGVLDQIKTDLGIDIPHVPTAGSDAAAIPTVNEWSNMKFEDQEFRKSLYASETGRSSEEFMRMIGQSAPAQMQQVQYATL